MKTSRRRVIFIYHQEILQVISLFTLQPEAKFYELYWYCKYHILVDCISGLPIYEITTSANISDSTVTLDILSKTNSFLSLQECSFLADKAYDVKYRYNTVKNDYSGEYFIALNTNNTKSPKKLPISNPICGSWLQCTKIENSQPEAEPVKNSVVLWNIPKQVNVPVITSIGTTERKILAAPNILQFLMITDYQLTETQ